MPSGRVYQGWVTGPARPDVPPPPGGSPVARRGPRSVRACGRRGSPGRRPAQRPEVVVAGDGLDLEPGRRREVRSSSAETRRSDVAPDPADGASPGPPSSKIEVRLTIPVEASCWAAATFVTWRPRLGIVADVLEDHPAVEAGEVVGVGQPDVDDGDPARREVRRDRPERLPLAVAGREQEQRVQGDEREAERAGRREVEIEQVRLDDLEPSAARDGRRGRVAPEPGRASPDRGRPPSRRGRPPPAGRRGGPCPRRARGRARPSRAASAR